MTEYPIEWLNILRHMLGASDSTPPKRYGYRNHFCATIGGEAHITMLAMLDADLVLRGRKINDSSMEYFHATKLGCEAIGLHKAAIKRAFSD